MLDARFTAFSLLNVSLASVSVVFAFLFLLLRVPDDGVLRNYRVCRKLLAALYFCYAVGSAMGVVLGDGIERSLEPFLVLSLTVSSFLAFSSPLAIVTIVNADYLRRRPFLLGLAPTVGFSALVLAGLVFDWDVAVRKLLFRLFLLYYAGQIAFAVRLVLTQLRWATDRMDNYFSGREGRFFSWVLPISLLLFADGSFAFLNCVFPSVRLTTLALLFSFVTYTILAVKFLNYAYEFRVVVPVITPGAEERPPHGTSPRLDEAESERKPLSVNLAGFEAEELLARLDALMRKKKLYRDPDLTVATLARSIDIPPRLLSELINHRLDMNFRNYVNSFRLEEVKRLLSQDGSTKILEAAFACGFNSKGNFNALFVKTTGKTPREWRRSMLEKAAAS
jgi:AraC-like DNA-binding protein